MCRRPTGAGPPWWAAGGGRVYRGDQCLYWGFCFAQRGAVTWYGPQSFRGRQGELAGPRVILNGGRGSAGAGSFRAGGGFGGPVDSLWLVSILEQVSFPLDELYSVLSWKVDLCCCLVGEIVGWFCSFLFSAPGFPWGRAGLAALGARVAAPSMGM